MTGKHFVENFVKTISVLWFGLESWRIDDCRSFNAKFIFIHLYQI